MDYLFRPPFEYYLAILVAKNSFFGIIIVYQGKRLHHYLQTIESAYLFGRHNRHLTLQS